MFTLQENLLSYFKKYKHKQITLYIPRITVAHVLRKNLLGMWNWMAGGKE
jgi:hypothetical protein